VADAAEALRTVRLRKTFESEGAPVRALRGVDLVVAPGEFVAVTGQSGCGKSTLLNLVAGLESPSDGEIVLAGESLAGKDESELAHLRRRHIGFVFQFFNLLEDTSALENVVLAAVIAGASRRRAEMRACELLDLLGLPDKAGALPAVLSGGQRQRLAIARALAVDPRILILDDATASVDASTEARIRLGLREAKRGRTTIIIAHRLSTIALADEIVVLDAGRVAARGTHDELLGTSAVYRDIYEHGLLERQFADAVEARAQDEALEAAS
jgi:putative ABC transport system ATP-binding protein